MGGTRGRMGGMSGMRGMGGMGGMGDFGMGGMGQGARSSHSPQPAFAIKRGTAVVVHGLESKPEHNGKTARILKFDESKGRYDVDVEGTTLSLRPRNLTQTCNVEVVNLENKPELNGSSGAIYNYDPEAGRYMVLVDSPSIAVGLQRGNCLLKPGTCVVVTGLSNQQFNGQMAQIVSVDRTAARYTVQCQNGKEIKIKYDNVLC